MYRRSRNEPPDRTGELIADRYRIERAIAQGGMGSVYLASQMNLQRQVAIKILPSKLGEDEGFRQRFMFEVATGARLQHPNIVSIYDYGETEGGELFMAMELVPGEPLSRAIEREGRLSPVRCCEIALQICSALNVAHKAGIVHRDLKPSNVMIGWSGEDELGDFVKVLDFGLAKRFGGEVPESEITDSGIWLGSVHYMSPEQIRCEDIDPRSDIYSLGVLMYHMLAARVPFAAPKVVDVLQKQLNEKPRPLQDLLPPEAYAPEVDVVMERCLEKNPDERYASVKDLATEL